jgi:hypothetical protein
MPRAAVQRNESTSYNATAVGVAAIGAPELESVVAKAVAAATEVIRKEVDKALQDFHTRLLEIETKLGNIEETCASPAGEIHELTAQTEPARREARQFAKAANDSEEHSRRNNLRFKGLNIANTDDVDYRKVAADFVRDKLSLRIDDNDIELAHPLPKRTSSSNAHSAASGSNVTSTGRRKEVAMIVRFRNRVVRDKVISRRRNLKGTNHAIVEDLTTLNIETLNRLRKDEGVKQTWSWNGHIHVMLHDGKKVRVHPFENLSECQQL